MHTAFAKQGPQDVGPSKLTHPPEVKAWRVAGAAAVGGAAGCSKAIVGWPTARYEDGHADWYPKETLQAHCAERN